MHEALVCLWGLVDLGYGKWPGKIECTLVGPPPLWVLGNLFQGREAVVIKQGLKRVRCDLWLPEDHVGKPDRFS